MATNKRQLTFEELARVDVLMQEINTVSEFMEDADDETKEQYAWERAALVAQVNTIYGTDHIMKGSTISVIK